MNFDRISHLLSDLAFRQAISLFPCAFSLLVLEEWRQFASWAMRYASHHFTRHDYIIIQVAGIITAFLSASLIRVLPHRWLVRVFFAFVFAPAGFFNALSHAGATSVYRVYCHGLLRALTVYPPLYYFLSRLAFRDLLSCCAGLWAIVVAGAFHFAEVSHNVFKAWKAW